MSASRTRRNWWTRRRVINAAFLLAFAIAFTTAWLIPASDYGRTVLTGKLATEGYFEMTYVGTPALSYESDMVIVTNGIFCANNPIDVEVTITKPNITDFRDHFKGVALWDAAYTDTSQGFVIPFQNDPNSSEHIAKGKIAFHKETFTFLFLVPAEHPRELPANMVLTSEQVEWLRNYTAIEIGPVTDALTVQINSFAVKIGFVFATFSLLIMPPVIEGIVIRHKDE